MKRRLFKAYAYRAI